MILDDPSTINAWASPQIRPRRPLEHAPDLRAARGIANGIAISVAALVWAWVIVSWLTR
jgi:hypothetical protein